MSRQSDFSLSQKETKSNVGNLERMASVTAGTLMLIPLLRKQSIQNWTSAAVAGVLIYRGASGHSPSYQALGLSTASNAKLIHTKQSITIGKSAQELHQLWRQPQAFTQVMRDFAKLTSLDTHHAKWAVKLPTGKTLEWETEVVGEQPGVLFHWRAVPESAFPNEGWLRFHPAPQDLGMIAELEFQCNPSVFPSRFLFHGINKAAKSVLQGMVKKILRNFKSLAETGEIATLEHNSSGRAAENGNDGDLI